MIDSKPVFTIGHSRHTDDAFVDLLIGHGITAIADVRSKPYSGFNRQFNRETIEATLRHHGIRYVFLGKELGARTTDLSCYKDGRVQYELLSKTDLFLTGIDRVVRGALEHRIALMCAEGDPLECHRTLLVAEALRERSVEIVHILTSGALETHSEAMERLLDVTGLPHRDMYRSREELIAEAVALQSQKVAYVDKDLAANAMGRTK